MFHASQTRHKILLEDKREIIKAKDNYGFTLSQLSDIFFLIKKYQTFSLNTS